MSAGGAGSAETIASGAAMCTVKREPRPGRVSRLMSPPIAMASRRAMNRPRPRPPCLRFEDTSTCSNGEKMRSAASRGTPGPVSSISMATRSSPPLTDSDQALIATVPTEVNLMALAMRLPMTCSRRARSTIRAGWRSGSIITESDRPLARTSDAQITAASSIRRTSDTGSGSMRTLSALRLERSRRSFSSTSIWRPASSSTPSVRRCTGSSLDCDSRLAQLSTAFIGVRSSWLMTPRNSVFAWLARSADVSAAASSAV